MPDSPAPEKSLRSPIGVIMGHVDSGKTSLLDKVRGTGVQVREEGGITQHVGASFFPVETINEVTSELTKGAFNLRIPGILIVDTPGHAAFMNLRSRGGAVADIAILVVDVTAGCMPITWEAVRILRDRRVPFLIAANKIDRGPGWRSVEKADFLEVYQKQVNREFGTEFSIPAVYFTQLIGLSLGIAPGRLGLGKELVSAAPVFSD